MADNPDLAHTSPKDKVSKSQAQDKIRLPMWGWALMAGGGAVFAWYVYRARKAAATASATSPAVSATSTPEGCTDATGTTIACPTVVPYPVAGTTGSTPAQSLEYQNLEAQINTLQGSLGQNVTADTGTTAADNTTTAADNATTAADNNVVANVPPPAPAPPPPPPPPAAPKTPSWSYYTVQPGDNLSSIAAKFGTTWQNLYTYNTTPGNRSAASEQTIESRGPNLIYSGESILVP